MFFLFSSPLTILPLTLLFSIMSYWFQLDNSHHIMLLPTLISLIEMFLPSALSIAGILYLESKIKFRTSVKLDGENCIIIIVNVLLKFHIFFNYQLAQITGILAIPLSIMKSQYSHVILQLQISLHIICAHHMLKF